MFTAYDVHALTELILEKYTLAMKPLSKELHIPLKALEILMFLANNPEHASAKEICDSLHMKSGIVSVHIDRLVEDGYLTRETSHADRRLISLRVTSKATPIKLKGQALQKQFLSDAFAGMSWQFRQLSPRSSICFTTLSIVYISVIFRTPAPLL